MNVLKHKFIRFLFVSLYHNVLIRSVAMFIVLLFNKQSDEMRISSFLCIISVKHLFHVSASFIIFHNMFLQIFSLVYHILFIILLFVACLLYSTLFIHQLLLLLLNHFFFLWFNSTHLRRLTYPRPFIFLPWSRLLMVMVNAYFYEKRKNMSDHLLKVSCCEMLHLFLLFIYVTSSHHHHSPCPLKMHFVSMSTLGACSFFQ